MVILPAMVNFSIWYFTFGSFFYMAVEYVQNVTWELSIVKVVVI